MSHKAGGLGPLTNHQISLVIAESLIVGEVVFVRKDVI